MLATVLLCLALEASAAISYVRNVNTRGTGTTISMTINRNTVAGDFLLAQITLGANGGCSLITPPAGWNLLACNPAPGTSAQAQAIFYRVAVSTDARKVYRWTLSSSTGYVGLIYTFKGVDTANPIDAGPSFNTYVTTTSATATNITIVTPGAMAVTLVSANRDSSNLFSRPSGWTEITERRCNGNCAGLSQTASYKLYPTSGTTAGVTTILTSAQTGIVYLLALRPYSQVAYYPLDGVSWLSDLGGYGYNAAANGTAAANPGKVCTGFGGDGAGWITVASNASQNLTSTYGISAWVRPMAYPAAGGLKAIVSKLNNYELYVDATGHLYWTWCENSNCATRRSLTSAGTLPLNQWTHVAIAFDQNTNSLLRQVFYINGSQDANTQIFQNTPVTATTSLFIGGTSGYTSGTGNANRNFVGDIDEIRLYNSAITSAQVAADIAATHACSVDHYRITIDGKGLTCLAEPIAITACGDASCSSSYSGSASVRLSTTAGTLSSTTVVVDGGSGSADLSLSTAGNATLGLSTGSPAPTATAGYRCFVSGVEAAMSACRLTFDSSRLLLTVPDLTACQDDSTATIAAEGCGAGFTGNQSVKFWATYSNPNTGTRIPKINNTDITTAAPGTAIALTFDAAGEAPFTINYADAGEVILTAQATIGGSTVSGNVTFQSAPDHLLVYSDDANAACTPASATCSVFKKAGEVFPLKVKAACWEAVPSANPATAPETPNFILAGNVMGRNLVAPAGGNAGSVSATQFDFGAADRGVATVSQSVSEVGVFQFVVTPASYLGNVLPTATSANIGRFVPDHIDTVVTEACGSFTYSGQPMSVQLNARNAAGGTTLNYDASAGFAKAVTMTASGATGTLSANTIAASAYLLGVASATTPAFTFSTAPSLPATITLGGSDSDNVALVEVSPADPAKLRTANIRSGRLALSNAYGSQLLPLAVPIKTQSWSTSGWITNAADSCTTLTVPTSGNGGLSNGLSSKTTATLSAPVVAGDAKARLTAPLDATPGVVDISGNVVRGSNTWLSLSTPTARACFGLCGPRSPVIYLRERF